MTWTLFWQFVLLILWTSMCVRSAGRHYRDRRTVRDHTDNSGVRWIGDQR